MVCPASRVAFCGDFINGQGFGRIEGALRSAQALAGRLLALLLLCLALAGPAMAAAAEAVPYRCDGDLLLATSDNGAVDAPGIPNSTAGTVPGATVLLEWRDLRLQLPRTNNAGPPSYTDGLWWWSLENPQQPRSCTAGGHRTVQLSGSSCRSAASRRALTPRSESPSRELERACSTPAEGRACSSRSSTKPNSRLVAVACR